MKLLRKKSISLFIALAVAVCCLAAPVSANAETVDTAVVKKTEVSVLEESNVQSSVKSTEIDTEEDDFAFSTEFDVEDDFVMDEMNNEIEDSAVVPESTGKELIFTNEFTGATSKVVVEHASETVVCDNYITLNTKDITLDKNGTYALSATVHSDYKSHGVSWGTTNKNIATVSSNGVVTATGKGSCYITATIKGTNLTVKTKVSVRDYILMEVKTTAYCGCSKCNGKWTGQPTASGVMAVAGRTIAVDRNVIKLGTRVEIDGVVYIAEDTGVKGKHIDIYHDSHSAALKYGVKFKIVKVYI